MLCVGDGEMSQIEFSKTRVRYIHLNGVLNKNRLKGCIAACYETWFYEYPQPRKRVFHIGLGFHASLPSFLILEILSFMFH